jgi:hypothetical protein
MSRIQVDDIYDKEGTGAPTLPVGVNVTGVATATTFNGNVSGTTVVASTSVSVGGTSVMTAIDTKTSPGKAIALSMVFG